MGSDGFVPADQESIEAVRSVVRETLDRATDSVEADWAGWASAGLLSLAVPETHGGEGLGLAEVAVLLRETGTRAAHLPVWETLCCGALTLAAAGTDEQQQAWLPKIAAGEALLTPALREPGIGITGTPGTTYADGKVTGRKIGVTYAGDAARLLVTAVADGNAVVALVDPSDPGVTLLTSPSSSGIQQHTVVLDGAAAELLERPAPPGSWSSTPSPGWRSQQRDWSPERAT